MIRAQRAKKLTRGLLPAEVADEAVKAGIINEQEAKLLKEALVARLEAIEVDVFKPEEFFPATEELAAAKPGLRVANA
ncbi:acyl-CoA dehydrogenase [compost metagenome]